MERLKVEADEVVFLLSDHLRADLGDFLECFTEDGRIDVAKAKSLGLSHLLKKYRSRTRIVTHSDGSIERRVTTDIELHDSQAAARTLADIYGLKQMPKSNDYDVRRKREQAESCVERLVAECGLGRDEAEDFLRKIAPTVAQWLM